MPETASAQAAPTAHPPPPASDRATVIVVLGAGRSGTSAITRGLDALGVDLGDNQRLGSGKNPTGFFEDKDILAISRQLKRALGIRGHSLRLLDDAEFDSPRVRALRAQAAEALGRRFGGKPLWGYKYARTLRTLPFWQGVHDALDLDVRYLLALRNPLSVARSRAAINPQRGRQVWSDLEWLVNVVPFFQRTAAAPRAVVDFDRLMAEPEGQLARVARDLGLLLGPDQQSSIDEYAHRFLVKDKPASRFMRDDLVADPSVNRWTAEGYAVLDEAAADELTLDSPAFTRRWADIEAAVADLGPLLAEFDHLRASTVRARWNPTSPVEAMRQVWRDFKAK